ncbi:efflux RND transporter periplasmic adaptor subunit [Aquicella lusitana]|uniref:Multidrug efflux system membrane fusion protein n=1 Tax=Aquicella lusitana TaxID=254246 RepID=A0A370G0D0_9COXI|nr:efflux RND transporter periplasmic adaptor subunit [Aquicella lusitana]RDI37208.1 multidrug efflux system membrane fusion protein [Aquicella lusitana]VVC74282.1 Multidrug resistance protein MdtA [Aquicella lusitana]
MKQKLTYIYIAAGLIFLLLIYYFFFTGHEKQQTEVNVSVSPVIQKDVEVNIQTIGTVQAYATVDIKSMVTGPLLKTGFKEGDVVEENQLLFQIDPRQFAASLNQAKATLARDQATLANAELQVKRNAPLLKRGFVARQDYDTLLANAKSAAATVKADEAAVENAQLQLDYTTVRAPIPGKTGNILLKPGSVIKANDTTPLVTINQINPIYVSFAVPQNKLPALQKRLQSGPLQVKTILNDGHIERGEVTFVDNTVDTTTGTIQLKATFANENRRLWPGQYVTVDLPIEHLQNALLVPSLALLTGQKGFYVYVIDASSIAHIRAVTPGSTVNNQTIIEHGLKKGEKVVTAGQLRLKEGTPVKFTTP